MHLSLIALMIPGAILLAPAAVEAARLNLTFCCDANNDLYRVLAQSGYRCARYDDPATAVDKATNGSAVLILADGYPSTRTRIDPEALDKAVEKDLRMYVEYPHTIPGIEFGEPRGTLWERGVVASDSFGSSLEKGRIVAIQGCRYLPAKATNPILAVARIAGYDRAVYGIPENAAPVLFELPERSLIVATTKLSGFVTGRYAPMEAWKTIWERILAMLDPKAPAIELNWEQLVRPAYGPNEKLPKDAELRSVRARAKWYTHSRLLIDSRREPAIHKALAANAPDSFPVPVPNEPSGDGSLGIMEGYASAVNWDGSQNQLSAIRADCNAESAMVLALDWATGGEQRSRAIAEKLTDFVYFNSGMCKGPRGNPKHPAYGMIAWGDVSPAWLVANYGDDCARTMLSTMALSATLHTDRWDAPLIRALLANLRTTGPEGFRGDRLDIPALEQAGWKHFHDASRVNYAPHFEGYLWACYLWAYQQTGYREFLERTRTAIKMTMDAYPDQWRWRDSIERARFLLPLAWLVRVDDTPEHRAWLRRIADDLLAVQDSCGALQERVNETGGGGHYFAPKSNEAYGTGETPLIQENGECASDQLYTTGFALLGLHEAHAATGDLAYKNAEDRLADFLVRIQVSSPKLPYLDGTWFRAFDYKRWEYWASSGDAGWGAWSAESGWAQAWTAAVFALRVKKTSFWEMTAGVNVAKHFRQAKDDLAQTPEGPNAPR